MASSSAATVNYHIVSPDDQEFQSLSRTVLLVGCVGNGKSATGNSILGREVFKSQAAFSGVTSSSKMESAKLDDGRIINVIDTIGLFNSSFTADIISNEIVKSVGLPKHGLHAVLLVLSLRFPLFEEEATTLQVLQDLFGPKVFDYLIVVFTGGDVLKDTKETFDDFMSRGLSETLQEVLDACKGRRVIFDNKTKNRHVLMKQRRELLELIEDVNHENKGHPYTSIQEGNVGSQGQARLEMSVLEDFYKIDVASAKEVEGHARLEISELKEGHKFEELKKGTATDCPQDETIDCSQGQARLEMSVLEDFYKLDDASAEEVEGHARLEISELKEEHKFEELKKGTTTDCQQEENVDCSQGQTRLEMSELKDLYKIDDASAEEVEGHVRLELSELKDHHKINDADEEEVKGHGMAVEMSESKEGHKIDDVVAEEVEGGLDFGMQHLTFGQAALGQLTTKDQPRIVHKGMSMMKRRQT